MIFRKHASGPEFAPHLSSSSIALNVFDGVEPLQVEGADGGPDLLDGDRDHTRLVNSGCHVSLVQDR